MGTKLKFKFTNEDDVDDVRQAYPMQRRRSVEYDDDDGAPVVHRATLARSSKRSPHATEERYVRRVTVQEVSTNDSTVSLNGALRSTYEFMQLGFGFGAAGLCVYFLGDAISFTVKVAVACVAFFLGYMFIRNLRSDNAGNGKDR
jgi:hypothetical protein